MSDFDHSSGIALSAIMAAIDATDLDCDVELKGDGVIEITLDDDSRIIVNRHSAAREIWLAAKSGGYHFRLEGNEWISTRGGERLMETLQRCLQEQTGRAVILRG